MGKNRPEREFVVQAYMETPRRKAHEIAREIGLVDSLGYDKAVDYVRNVKKAMIAKGQLKKGAYATDEERLADITELFKLRKGQMSHKAAYIILLLNCYYRLRSENDSIHMKAIDDTYEKNMDLRRRFGTQESIQICGAALTHYMNSIDEEKNEEARKHGYPGAGLNYTDDKFIDALEITEEEIRHLKSIRKE